MRVIAGEAKGCTLIAPPGLRTRPATELVRGAIFSILYSVANDWKYVLDLFSGSGSLGIEALSRERDGWILLSRHPMLCYNKAES
jgi:16S rRNA G966 N2-methylase RsmD